MPVMGHGTSRVKLGGKIICLPLSLHVPGSDWDPFSTTRHGLAGEGKSFMLSDGEAHSTFPNFAIERNIPMDCDSSVHMEPLTEEEWC